MINKSPVIRFISVALLFAGVSANALADDTRKIRYADELDACVTALRGKIDLEGVTRIQHVVTRFQAQNIGYALSLETSTFAPEAERRYSAYCVAVGKNTPSRLRVEEKAG